MRAVNCEEDLKLGFEADTENYGANDQCVDPDDEFEGLPLLDDGTSWSSSSVFFSFKC